MSLNLFFPVPLPQCTHWAVRGQAFQDFRLPLQPVPQTGDNKEHHWQYERSVISAMLNRNRVKTRVKYSHHWNTSDRAMDLCPTLSFLPRLTWVWTLYDGPSIVCLKVNGKNENPIYTYLKRRCPSVRKKFRFPRELYYEPYHQDDIRLVRERWKIKYHEKWKHRTKYFFTNWLNIFSSKGGTSRSSCWTSTGSRRGATMNLGTPWTLCPTLTRSSPTSRDNMITRAANNPSAAISFHNQGNPHRLIVCSCTHNLHTVFISCHGCSLVHDRIRRNPCF